MSTTPHFEIPTDMRKMAEQSLEQVRTAINGYLQKAYPADSGPTKYGDIRRAVA
jgi:hypothetical protein